MAGDKSGVGRQIHLPLRRAFMISLKSIKIRFWRSVITAAGIFLGITFLVSVLAQMSLQAPPVPEERIYPDVYARGMVGKPMDKPLEPGLTAKMLLDEAGGIKAKGDKAQVLVVKSAGDRVLLDLGNPATPEHRLAGGDVVFVPDSRGRLRQLIIALVVVVAAIVALVLTKKVEDRKRKLISQAAVVVLGVFLLWFGLMRAGLTPPNAPKVTVIQSYHIRGEIKAASDIPAGKGVPITEAIVSSGGFTRNADVSHVIVLQRGKGKIEIDLSPAGKKKASRILLRAGDLVYIPDASARNRQIWLVVMSLMVCTVGISNSMLMSVTERFKEIGTMKCLGALDKFVVELFLLEAMLLGLCASFAGWLVGFGIMSLLAVVSQGWGLLFQLSLAETARTLGIAIGVGSALTMIATIAPAIRAAEMPPAAALRVEI